MMQTLKNLRTAASRELSLINRIMYTRVLDKAPTEQPVIVLNDFLPQDEYLRLKNQAIENKDLFIRKKSVIRNGAAIDLHELQKSPCASLVDSLVNPDVLDRVRVATDRPQMDYVDQQDTNQISLLYYAAAGDGIDWHFDGTIYLGERWAGIYTLHEETRDAYSKLELEQNGEIVNIPVETVGNSLILFQGDQVKHRVRPMRDGEERLVSNLLFTTDPQQSRNPLLHLSQLAVNYAFYGKLKHRRATEQAAAQ